MKKSILTIALTAVMCVLLVACSAPAPAASSAPAASQEAASQAPAASAEPVESASSETGGNFVIGFSNASVSNPWRVAMKETFDYVATQNKNVKIIETDANDDAQKQLGDCEDLLSQDINALIVSPSVTDALTPIIQKCKDKGIPLVVVDRAIGGEGYDAFVRTDGHELGKIAADSVNEYFNGKAEICYISGFPGSGPDNERTEGFMEQLKQYPGIKVLAEQPGNWDEATSLTVMENLIQGYPKMQAVVTSDGTEAVSAYKALQAAGKENDIKIIVMDNARNDSYQMLVDGKIVATSGQNPVYCGAWALNVAIDLLNGKKLNTAEVLIPSPELTKDNAAQYIDSSLPNAGFPWKVLYEESMQDTYPGYFS